MKKLSRIIVSILIAFDALLLVKILISGKNVQVLNPQGYIAFQERSLLFVVISLMLIVVIPVFILAIHVATHYHEGNKKAKFDPDWQSPKLQIFLWAFPTFIILILCVINWLSAHALDPSNAIAAGRKQMTVEVVALRWKWLFIYPEQHIASVNYLVFPEKTPIHFELTALDTPMNSFWIPQLGGQIYAMGGMSTQTHLIANGIGTYRGSNAEINGQGFADMTFVAKSVSQDDFDGWVAKVKQAPQMLDQESFDTLAKPSISYPVTTFASTDDNLYSTIVMHYMARPTMTPAGMYSAQKQGMQGM